MALIERFSPNVVVEVNRGGELRLGTNTVILRGTHIGDNCVVGAGCVLKGTFPDGSVIVQKRNAEIICESNVHLS